MMNMYESMTNISIFFLEIKLYTTHLIPHFFMHMSREHRSISYLFTVICFFAPSNTRSTELISSGNSINSLNKLYSGNDAIPFLILN